MSGAGAPIAGFEYATGAQVSKTRAEWQALERGGMKRQVDGAKSETWYRNRDGRLAFEAYAVIPSIKEKDPS